ncbi:hypothetical protein GOV05_00200 [Candidatus Woesearchaeota archaeon]|nr:hypothetical protein [Candidatus Woesearchaeota archaeon]
MALRDDYLKILMSNQREVDGFRYTVPSSKVYPHQWLWDSCFHSIIYSSFEMFEKAKDEIRSLLENQWVSGMVPHMTYWQESKKHNIDWGTNKNTSSITQPPMIAYAAERIYEETKDKGFVIDVFEKLDKYYKWLHKERSDDYVLSIIHPWESGEDDFVAWDNVLGLNNPTKEELRNHKIRLVKEFELTGFRSKRFIEKNVFNVKCVLFNCVYLRNLKSMKKLSGVVGKQKKYYNDMVNKVSKAIKKQLYDENKELFISKYNGNKEIKDYLNSSVFLPLFAGLLTKKQAKKLVNDYLLRKDFFWSDYPIPTISTNNPNFEAGRYWRGSTWMNINWFVYKGLTDYKLDKTRNLLRQISFSLVERNGFCEYYNSKEGIGIGPKDFCWSGLIFDMK